MAKPQERVVVYHASTADEGKQYLAQFYNGHTRLNMIFFGATAEQAEQSAHDFWDKDRELREKNIAAREEGRRKAAATRAKKAEVQDADA